MKRKLKENSEYTHSPNQCSYADKMQLKKSLFFFLKLIFFLRASFGCPAKELHAAAGQWITSPAAGDISITQTSLAPQNATSSLPTGR